MNDLPMFFRFARAFHEFLKTTISVEEARKRVLRMLEFREENFLRFARSAIFENANSPYLALCGRAGVEFGDLDRLVRSDGLESALNRLEREGIFVKLDEFRGRQPIRRPGLELPVRPSDFANPLASRHLENQSGGSTGAPRRIAVDLNLVANQAGIEMLFLEGAGSLYRPMVLYRTAPPGLAGFMKTLYQARMGHRVERWFSEKQMTYGPEEWRYALFTRYAHLAAGWQGKHIPLPEYTPLQDALRVAQWLAQKRAEGAPAVLDVVSSVGVRVARAALDAGLNISGSVFRVGSEPFTEARAAICRQAGVTVFPHYAMSEAGIVALACAAPEDRRSAPAELPAGRHPETASRRRERNHCQRVLLHHSATLGIEGTAQHGE